MKSPWKGLGELIPADPGPWLASLSSLGLGWGEALESRVHELACRADGAVLCRLDTGWIWAGPPNPRPQLSEFWTLLNWTLPEPLRRVYALHDGIGPASGPRAIHWRDAVWCADRLEPLQARVRFGATSTFMAENILLFSPDGRGGGWCLARQDEGDLQPKVLHFDGTHHTLRPGPELTGVLRSLASSW